MSTASMAGRWRRATLLMLLHLLLFSARSAHPDDMDVSVRLRTSHCMVGCASELVVTVAGASRSTRACRTPRRVCALACVLARVLCRTRDCAQLCASWRRTGARGDVPPAGRAAARGRDHPRARGAADVVARGGGSGGEHAFVHALPPLPPGPLMLRASLLDAAASSAGAADDEGVTEGLLAAVSRRLAPRRGAGACAGTRMHGAGSPPADTAGGGHLAGSPGTRAGAAGQAGQAEHSRTPETPASGAGAQQASHAALTAGGGGTCAGASAGGGCAASPSGGASLLYAGVHDDGRACVVAGALNSPTAAALGGAVLVTGGAGCVGMLAALRRACICR